MSTNPFSVDELLAHRAWVRALARHLVREPAEAEDAVQDTWLAALEHPPRAGQPLGPWLARVLRNRVRRGRRSESRRREREIRAAERVPAGSELVDRVELQQELVRVVLALAEPDRSVLLLHYFEGLSSAELARRQGMPPATIRQRLKRARERLRLALDQRNAGERKTWSALFAVWSSGSSDPASVPTFPNARSSAMKPLLSLSLAALVTLGAATLLLRPRGPSVAPAEPAGLASVTVTPASRPAAAGSDLPIEGRSSVAVAENLAAPGGPLPAILAVRALRADGLPAVDACVMVEPSASRPPFAAPLRARTDAQGNASLVLGGGLFGVGLLRRGEALDRVDLAPGTTTTLELVLPPGYAVEGYLRDEHGRPIAAGQLWVGEPWSRLQGQVLATSDAQGFFRLSGLQPDGMHWFGAFAAGYAPSPVRYLDAAPGSVVQQDIVLRDGGGSLRGRVQDAAGRPLARVQVLAGFEDAEWAASADGWPPRRATADAQGEFLLEGLPAGGLPLLAHAPGFGPACCWVEVLAGGSPEVTLTLEPELRLAGRVRDPAGEPLAGARVEVADVAPFARGWTVTDAQGRYVLEGLTRGPVRVCARGAGLGAELRTVLGEPLDWSPTLHPVDVIAGFLRDAAGRPLPDRELALCEEGEFGRDQDYTTTDIEGHFSFGERRDVEHRLAVEAPALDLPEQRLGRAPAPLVLHDVRPGPHALELVLDADPRREGCLRVQVLGPDGEPPASALLLVQDVERGAEGLMTAEADGSFELRLQPGALKLAIEAEGFAPLELEPAVLGAGATLDLGTRVLAAPGFVSGTLRAGVLPLDLSLAWDDSKQASGRSARSGPQFRSPPLAPGHHVLHIQGTGLVSRSVDVLVEARAEQWLELDLTPAKVCWIELEVPPGTPRPGAFVAVARDGQGHERWSRFARFDPYGPLSLPVSLPGGTFTLEVRVDTGLRAEGTIDTGHEGPQVRLGLR